MNPKARVLLVDDEEVDFVITSRLLAQLEGREYELEWVETYEDAVRALGHNRHDVCLVDYQLGAKTGLDLLREATRMGCGIPIILLTGRGNEGIDLEAMSLGAAGYLDKDKVDSTQLDRILRYSLKRDRLVSDLLEHNEELVRLHNLTEIALLPRSAREIIQDAAVEISLAARFPIVMIELYDAEEETLTCMGSLGISEPSTESVPADQCFAGEVVKTRRPLLEMSLEGSRKTIRRASFGTFLCLPMVCEGHVVGALTLADTEAIPVDSTLVNRAATFATHLAALTVHVIQSQADAPAADRLGCRIDEELDRILLSLRPRAERKSVSIEVAGPPRPWGTVAVPPVQLRQILTFAADAALHYCEGTMRLVVRVPEGPGPLELEVGCAECSRSERSSGGSEERDESGAILRAALEIRLCRRLVERLGGSFGEVGSPAGVCFSVTLPR